MDNKNSKQPRKPEGTISVDYVPPVVKKQPKEKGNDDFIPYEEVK